MQYPLFRLRSLTVVLFLALFAMTLPGWAQSKPVDDKSDSADSDQQQGTQKDNQADPLKRPATDKERREHAKSLKSEVEGKVYKKWLNEDVIYIISDEERDAFKRLSNDEERDNFIEQFWLRRDPTPDTIENEYKEEHYERIAYANEHFAAGIPGWKTDRGKMYILYGKPDEIDAHPAGGTYERPQEEGGGTTSTFPFETWRYRYLEDVGQEVIIEFVDTCQCGEYHMTLDRGEKDALLNTPNAGLTTAEEMGATSKANRFNNGGLERLGTGPFNQNPQDKQFDRLEQFAKLQKAPSIKFHDLEERIGHHITVNPMLFDVRTDFVRVTSDTVLVPVTIQIKNKDVTFVNKDGVERGTVNIFGRATTIGGRIAQTFEDTVQIDVPAELLPKTIENASVYWKALPLHPGKYRLDVVVKDVNGDRTGTWGRGVDVPEYNEEKLASSTLILADQMEPVPSRNVGTGNFVIGTTKVRPRVASSDGKPVSFKRNQRLNFWMQVYNLSVDDKTHKPSATVEYSVVDAATNKAVIHSVENTEQMGNIGEQVTLQKTLSASSLQPGVYHMNIKVNDNLSKQALDPSVTFSIE
jgi:GWxTD domain-containing protein